MGDNEFRSALGRAWSGRLDAVVAARSVQRVSPPPRAAAGDWLGSLRSWLCAVIPVSCGCRSGS